MAKIIKESEIKEDITYFKEFYYEDDHESGFSFPCDEDGTLLSELNEYAVMNYHACLSGMVNGRKILDAGIKARVNRYKEPAVLECDCGFSFSLTNQYMGACQCPECGQWYNLFGQELMSPDSWEVGNE